VITAEGLRPQEGKAETWEGEALLDDPVGKLEDADAAGGEQIFVGLQHSTAVALALGAEKGKWIKHPLDGGHEMQRAQGRKGQVILYLMSDAFLLFNCSWDLASDLSFPEQSLVPNAAFQRGLSCTEGPGCLEPSFCVGKAEQLIQQFHL